MSVGLSVCLSDVWMEADAVPVVKKGAQQLSG